MSHAADTSSSIDRLLAREDARPSADYSAWVLPPSGDTGAAANEMKKPADRQASGQSASPRAQMKSDVVLLLVWLGLCVAVGAGLL